MELSWRYKENMARMITADGFRLLYSQYGNYFPAALVVDVAKDGFDAPTFCAANCRSWYGRIGYEDFEAVLPLCIDQSFKQCSGGDAILNYFSRGGGYNTDRLATAKTPKGEFYYGNRGIILDKDYNPLLLSTVRMNFGEGGYPVFGNITVHLSPKVFTDDEAILNKALAKKGMQYFLTTQPYFYGESRKVEVKIEDMSKFVRKVKTPDLESFSEEEIQKLLQDNIDEVLWQFSYDKAVYG